MSNSKLIVTFENQIEFAKQERIQKSLKDDELLDSTIEIGNTVVQIDQGRDVLASGYTGHVNDQYGLRSSNEV
jgi:hypothetical protein